ncbi:hypothetical protein BGW36DRAFT_165514, partial [Talaromyces proteolyticus]
GISHKTGAYVKKPDNHAKVCDEVNFLGYVLLTALESIQLWGSSQSVQAAKSLLSALFKRHEEVLVSRQQHAWVKVKPTKSEVDDYESEIISPKKADSLIEMLRNPPIPGSGSRHRMAFLWPVGEIPIGEVLGADLEGLDFLRSQYKCFIYLSDGNTNVICVSSSDQETLQLAIGQLEEKCHELIVTSTSKNKLYLVDLPSDEKRVEAITIMRNKELVKPCFVIKPSDDSHNEDVLIWEDTSSSDNDTRLLSAIKRSLCCVPFISGTLSMRVSLGTFIFEHFRAPKNPDEGYSVDEFKEMVSNERMKGRLLPGLKITKDTLIGEEASRLFQLAGRQPFSFTGGLVKHMVTVEFDAINNDKLKLEIEFKAVGPRYERIASRWVECPAKGKFVEERSLLQAIILDTLNADWQLEIKENKTLAASQINNAMEEFDHSLRLRQGLIHESLMTKPKRRTILPGGFPIRRLIEKAAIQLPIIGTDYVLEIARYDTYEKGVAQTISDVGPSSFSWGGALFGINWDQDLKRLAEKKQIQQMGYYSILDPFFNQNAKDGSKAGFQGFISVVKDVSRLLGKNE